MRLNAVTDFSELAKYCNGTVETFAFKAQFAGHYGLDMISRSNLIPIAADLYLTDSSHGHG